MRLTTKGRYGMRLVLDIAQHQAQGPVSINEISRRQGVSAKYLERLVGDLRRAGFVRSLRGRDGGHVLAMSTTEITVGGIVRALEGESFLLACCKNRHTCPRSSSCLTRAIWIAADQAMYEKLNGVSVQGILDDARNCAAGGSALEQLRQRDAASAPAAGRGARNREARDVCPAPRLGEAAAQPSPRHPPLSSPLQPEPVQADPVQGEPLHAEPVQADPIQADPVQGDPVQGSLASAGHARVRRLVRRTLTRRTPVVDVREGAREGAREERQAAARPSESSGPGRKVLLVLGDPDDLAGCQEELLAAGLECRAAGGEAQALELLALERPELVVLDLELPGGGGPRLCGELSRLLPSVPVLVLSSLPDIHLALRGTVGSLPRPAEPADLPGALLLALQRVLEDDLEHATGPA